MSEDLTVDSATTGYPPADPSPVEFEAFVTTLFASAEGDVASLIITPHEKISGVDGSYDFDATVRFELAGLSFLVLVEAKRHKNPVKRELVQVLHQKVRSVGGHKAVMFSTAPFQRGAIEFARTHGVALVHVTGGLFDVVLRDVISAPAWEPTGPPLVGHIYEAGSQPGSESVILISPERPHGVAELLLGVPRK